MMSEQLETNLNNQPDLPSNSLNQETKQNEIDIAEKIFALSIDDFEGAIDASVRKVLRYGLAGAILAELALAKKIRIEQDHLKVNETTVTGDPLIDYYFVSLQNKKKPRRLSYWIGVLGNKATEKQVAGRLVERGILSVEKKKYAWISPNPIYPQLDPSAKYWVKHHLRAVILAGQENDKSDVILLSLLNASRLLRLVFTLDEYNFAANKVGIIVKSEGYGETITNLLADISEVTKTSK